MNQYDLTPLPPEQHNKMRLWASVVLAAWILFCIAMLFLGCAEKDPMPTLDERLYGPWERKWLDFQQRYNFNAGGCAVYSFYPWKEPVFSYYSYYCEGDTLRIFELSGVPLVTGKAVVTFPTDSTAVFSWEGGVDYVLIKI